MKGNDPEFMPIKMVVGLGNPDKKYANTRHNVGYRVIDILKEKPIPGVRFFKPKEYMNSSGVSVAEMARKNGYNPQEILVVCDDFSIPLGQIRIRRDGSSGGHNGLNSIIESLNTEQVPRLRVGIGPVPLLKDPADYVLEPFSRGDEDLKASVLLQAVGEIVVPVAVTEGLDTAMNRFNNKFL